MLFQCSHVRIQLEVAEIQVWSKIILLFPHYSMRLDPMLSWSALSLKHFSESKFDKMKEFQNILKCHMRLFCAFETFNAATEVEAHGPVHMEQSAGISSAQ